MTRYRPEIDGLRALAVLPVIFFHVGFEIFAGGFVGVDVFFVISGYLIIGLILDALENKNFSFLDFYARRARRLLPALLLVIGVTTVFAWYILMPSEFSSYGRSVIWVALSLSNVFFWRGSGYFATGTDLQPMLHTWSLAVEEQFYIFFPLIMIACFRLGGMRSAKWAILGMFAVSFVLCEIASRFLPEANYYLLPFRAWELMAGGLVAIAMRPENVTKLDRYPGSLLSLLGLILLLLSVFVIDSTMRFPSAYALLPVGGTMLIILFGNQESFVNKLLSSRLLVFIGLMSYSAYLWHQPFVAFARTVYLDAPPVQLKLAIIAGTFLISYLSWRFVEIPFRQMPFAKLARPTNVVSIAAGALAATAGLGLLINSTLKPYWEIYHRDLILPAQIARDSINSLRNECHYLPRFLFDSIPDKLPSPTCIAGKTDGSAKRVALLGDSHADAIAQPLREAIQAKSMTFAQVTFSGCLFVGGYVKVSKNCEGAYERALKAMDSYKPDVVVLAGDWIALFTDVPFDNGQGGAVSPNQSEVIFTDPDVSGLERSEAAKVLIRKSIEKLLAKGVSIVLVYPEPEAGWNVPNRFLNLTRINGENPSQISTDFSLFERRQKDIIETLDSISGPKVKRIKPSDYICEKAEIGKCYQSRGKTIYYFDKSHFNNVAANLFSRDLADAVELLSRAQGKQD